MHIDTLLDQHIEITPDTRGGKPRITGTRITGADIVILHRRLGYGIEEITGTYDLSLAAVYAAMAYYYDHREAIDQSIEEDEAFVEAFKRDNPSLLQEKLKKIARWLNASGFTWIRASMSVRRVRYGDMAAM